MRHTKKNKKRRKHKTQFNKYKKYKNIKGGFTKKIIIKENEYTINLYKELPEHIRNEAKYMCLNIYDNYSNEDTISLVDDYLLSTDNDIYILSDSENNIISFIIMKNNLCEDNICFNCSTNNCSYLLLTCVKYEYRGRNIFKYFLREIEYYLKETGIDCIRLTAINKKVFNIYKSIGFNTENDDNAICEYKMIKYL